MMQERIAWPGLKRNLVAILRGLTFDEVEPVVGGLIEAGFEAIEIPLNSPAPFRSIEAAVRLAPETHYIGAGTVLQVEDVDRLAHVGGRLMVSPNIDAAIIQRASEQGMVTMPGVFSATEALAACKAGASALKFFPASVLGPAGIAAISAILPSGTVIGAVGGVADNQFQAYANVGVRAFGLGSSLYKPGMPAAQVALNAKAAVAAYDAAFAGE
ncbi:2-dehydro-3-deoxy-6-phosphogalactonate aldolase [Aureimonas fodinaquatilis]|uniref:2-dehydro-3-deoxy-6-phosphogalactonate aldolase n=1 Tax=Aureimonas fodinaquatilis TaxID=2565783 RepID=A0A5B0E038_9HYPH|nr:2-dehydro-3-deoxy-6-phosphogalactonate aldolase [Aureimonas fodinaquatilis]KAA0972056.1 2-dehydro-3-deoxy-6-phosphogalactonate aldolase [Aureimonas fodinaquatilis]